MQRLNFGDKSSSFTRAGATRPSPVSPPPARRDWMDGIVDLLFNADGRVSRTQYWISMIVFSVVNQIVLFMIFRPLIALLFGVPLPPESVWYNLAQNLTLFAAACLLLWWSVVVSIKRWHDVGKSGLWELIIFVPVIGMFWKLVVCGFFPGTDGANGYGPSPR